MSKIKNFKCVERRLYYFQRDKDQLKQIKNRITQIYEDGKTTGINYSSDKIQSSNSYNSSVENAIIDLEKLQGEYIQLSKNIYDLEKALTTLNEKEKEFIENKYFNCFTWGQTCKIMNMSSIYYLRRNTIIKLIKCLY